MFWHLNPAKLQPFKEAYQKKLELPESAKYSVEDAKKSLQNALNGANGDTSTSSFKNYAEEINNLKSKLKELESIGQGMGSDEWDRAYIKLKKVTAEAKKYKASLDEHATGIDTDIKETDSLDTKVNKLREDLKQLKADGFGFGDSAFDKTYQQLNKAEQELSEYKAKLTESKTETRNFDGVLKSVSAGFSAFIGGMKKTGAVTLGFIKNIHSMKSPLKIAAGEIGKIANSVSRLYFKFFTLSIMAGAVGKVVGISSDYIEEYNYFQKAIDKIAQENKNNYKQYGYDDAESYVDSFQSSQTDVLRKICAKCNSKTRDVDISIHFNSADHQRMLDGKTTGTEVWVRDTTGVKGDLAKRIVNAP